MRAFDDGRDRSEFYRGWRQGQSAGLSHPAILEHLGTLGGTTRLLRDHLLAGTKQRRDIASLVRARPDLLEPFESALLRLGEESGQLEPVLGALAEFHMRQYKLVLKVKKMMSYPMFVSLCAVVIGPLPLVFTVGPGAYFATATAGFVLWLVAGGSVLARLAQRYQRRPAFVRARLARALATCIEAGLPLGRAAMLAAEASGDVALAQRVRRLGELTLTTQPLSVTFQLSELITPEFSTSLQMAERTGDYSTTLHKLAALYEDGFK